MTVTLIVAIVTVSLNYYKHNDKDLISNSNTIIDFNMFGNLEF